MNLLVQLAISTGMVLLTTLVHLGGLAGLLILIRQRSSGASARMRWHDLVGIVGAALGLFALHGIEIWGYAALYIAVGAMADFETALYFSTTTYATIGYGDILLNSGWRIVGAIEGVNGIILLGWSTAFFVAMVRRISFVELEFGQGS
ncbi:MAG TPA: potassium channel family protein [Sphingomonas sp.]|nr:potassium channel family protein [Sphingomonas sp.]